MGAEDLVFYPPTYWKVRRGRFIGALILREACQIFRRDGDEEALNFRYHRQLVDERGRNAVLEFSAMVDEIPIQGVDMLEFSPDGQLITEIKVMVRPPEGALRLRQRMAQRIAHALKHEFGL